MKKLKVYVVSDIYRWYGISIYSDIFQNWINMLEDENDEMSYTFQTIMMTRSDYERCCKEVNKPITNNAPMPLPTNMDATILPFPEKPNNEI